MNLNVIQVAEPCTVDWDTMSGNERVRHCGVCRKNVYDLSTLTRADAEALIERHDGDLCVRFYRRADGTVQTSDCSPIRQRLAAAARRTRQRLAVACSGLLALAGLTLATRFAHAEEPAQMGEMVAGGLAPPATQPAPPPTVGRTMGLIAESTPPATQPTVMGKPAGGR